MVEVHLIDALPYVFRAYFSIPTSMKAPDGAQSNAVYGFANFLVKYIDDVAPTHAAICFDESLITSFRNEIYPDYKANRELPPPALEAQLRGCRDVAEALGFRCFADDRYEADDLIATLCAALVKRKHEVVVTTIDKDMAQLVTASVTFFDYAKNERYGPEEVLARFGVRPEQVTDYLGLAGDAVDNIPGVKGVGVKTAIALLEEFADLDELYGDLDRVAQLKIRGARTLAAKLEASKDSAFLSRELATVSTAAPAKASLAELQWSGAEEARCSALFARWGFEGLQKRFGG